MFCNILISDPKSHAQPALVDAPKEILNALNNLSFVDRAVPQGDFSAIANELPQRYRDVGLAHA
jgi:hypothetical protein